MLSAALSKKIQDFVYSKPRSIQEIAVHIAKNWRTADRYIDLIAQEYGTLATRVFREGTRGALKIVYWASVEKISTSLFQDRLEEEIMRARWKEDFSAFDIFQFAPSARKNVKVENEKSEEAAAFKQITNLYQTAQKQLLIFSGNLSFIRFKDHKTHRTILDTFDQLLKRGVSMKILCRVDLAGRKNVEDMLALNYRHGKELIEIRHRAHPLRATIIDKQCFDIKEVKEPTGNIYELDKKVFIFYNIKDKDWVEWLSKIFWKMFSASLDANKRLAELQKLR